MKKEKQIAPWLVLGFFAFLCSLSFGSSGCGKKTAQATDTTKTDSSYVSDHFLNDSQPTASEPEPNPDPSPSHQHSSHSHSSEYSGGSSSSSGGSSSTAGQVWSSKYQNYLRSGTEPRDFAEAMVWHVIRMTYDEDFKAAKSRVINSQNAEGLRTIEMEVVWSDEWIKNYTIRGTLTVNEDGTDAKFEVSSKNAEAEALEFTHDSKSSISLEQI